MTAERKFLQRAELMVEWFMKRMITAEMIVTVGTVGIRTEDNTVGSALR